MKALSLSILRSVLVFPDFDDGGESEERLTTVNWCCSWEADGTVGELVAHCGAACPPHWNAKRHASNTGGQTGGVSTANDVAHRVQLTVIRRAGQSHNPQRTG